MRYLYSFIIFILFACITDGQEISEQTDRDGVLFLRLRNINFIKNNEYYNPIIEGYTLIGYFIQPSLIYCPTDKLDIQAGTHFLNYAGSARIDNPQIVFSTTYSFTENTSLTLGTLNGSDKHRLLDPHFDRERIYKYYTENGIQFITKNNHLFSDTWLSWENFIFKGDTTREVFTAGESFNYLSPLISETFTLEFPVQLQFKHYGGQISNYNSHVVTYFNMSAGLKVNASLSGGRLGYASVEYQNFLFNELTGRGEIGIKRGSGNWFRFLYGYKNLRVSTSYWHATDFYAPNGNPIYSSISDYRTNLIISGRSIWTNSLVLTARPYNFFSIYFGFDLYYDLDLRHFDNSIGMHLNFNKLIRLAKVPD